MPNRSAGVIRQDWEPVVMHKTKPRSQDLRDPKAVNQALRSGAPVQTIRKFDAGSNKKATAPAVSSRRLEEETEPAALGRVSTEPKVVQEYENGKAVPNQVVLAKDGESARREA
ncbi:hypothetical protein OIU84_000529 [Salix udensis]|uniref:Multiprotein bridging factor 1 N-terminal domain-containing protein n=1 Tax=Salix udensis TaxID=889485 RepID=A0AAD6L4Y1_9ROSI|nr:hypothetical protein OIU84_000529 [Salix udensis]